jgi:hypothetical protein
MAENQQDKKWKWIRTGFCNMCGDCCNLNNWFGEQVRNPSVEFDKDGRCIYQDKETKKCIKQREKPLACVVFPIDPEELISLPNCTYRFIKEWEK